MRDAVGAAIDGNDLDALNRLIDNLCETRDWELLVSLSDRARRAFDRGYQLWPAAAHADYRLALEAPGEFAAVAVRDVSTQFALGPLTEVAASTHTYDELAAYLDDSPSHALFAHERVVRGEDLSGVSLTHADVLDVPRSLAAWEPEYCVATYSAARVDAPGPDLPKLLALAPDTSRAVRPDRDVVAALRAVADAWAVRSNARVEVVSIEGSAAAAIGEIGHDVVFAAELSAGEAMRLLAWAGASGGAHGRRRGAAAGRDAAWHAAKLVAGYPPYEVVPAGELGAALDELRWFAWNAATAAGEPGWMLRVAIEDPRDGVAFAIDAVDRADA